MSISVSSTVNGDIRTVSIDGEVDVSNADELRKALDEALASPAAQIEIDLSHVPYIDSTGIGVLVGASRRASEDARSLSVVHPQRNVARVLSLLGVGEELGVNQ